MTALLLATLAAFSVNVMLLTTHVLSAEVPDENGSGAVALVNFLAEKKLI